MVVVAAALTVAHEPCAVGLVEIFTDIRTAAVVLALHIHLHVVEELLTAKNRGGVVVDVVAHRRQRLACGERPYSTVPFACPRTVGAE